MTQLPTSTTRKMGLVIDLDTCVGCHACVISCKGWNTENYGAPLSDQDPYGADPSGTFLNRVHSYEVQPEQGAAQLTKRTCRHRERTDMTTAGVFVLFEPPAQRLSTWPGRCSRRSRLTRPRRVHGYR